MPKYANFVTLHALNVQLQILLAKPAIKDITSTALPAQLAHSDAQLVLHPQFVILVRRNLN